MDTVQVSVSLRPSSCTLKPRFLSLSSKTYAKFVVETLFNIEKNSFHRNFWNYIGNFITIESKKKPIVKYVDIYYQES